MMSAVWNAMLSIPARTTCAAVDSRVNPTTAALASRSQCGAHMPPKAGTTYTPPESGTSRARYSISSLDSKSRRLSFIQDSVWPEWNTTPSSS